MLVVATGTIKPYNSVPYLSLVDAEVRLKQYYDAIENLLKCQKITKLIFTENSNYTIDFSNLYRLAEENEIKFEVLQFQGSEEEVILREKGYGEGEAMDYMLSNSKLIENEEFF